MIRAQEELTLSQIKALLKNIFSKMLEKKNSEAKILELLTT